MPDPFWDAVERHSLIGVANVYLNVLKHKVKFDYNAPIIGQEGKVCGKLLIEIEVVESLAAREETDNDELSENSSQSGQAENEIRFRLNIKSAVGVAPSLAHFVFCQYAFWGDTEMVVVPSLASSVLATNKKDDTSDIRFNYSREISRKTSEEFRLSF